MKVEVTDSMGGKLIKITHKPIKINGITKEIKDMEILVKCIHDGSTAGAGLKIIK